MFNGLKEMSSLEIQKTLKDELELTKYQSEKLRDLIYEKRNVIKFFEYKPKAKAGVLMRMSIVFVPFVLVIMILGLPFNYIRKGEFYYRIDWIIKWFNKLNIF